MQEKLKTITKNVNKYITVFAFWLLLGAIMGSLGGLIGGAFAHSISFVTELRENNKWLLFLLPIGALLSVAVTHLCKLKGVGTNQVFESSISDKKVSFLLAPVVFFCSGITHLFGGSAGREGAALQLGGGTASLLAKIFRLNETNRRILVRCGMAAFFSAIFGTPMGASVFALEVVIVGSISLSSVFPVFVSGITGYFVAAALEVEPERFSCSAMPEISLHTLLGVLIIAVAGALVSMLFCKALHTFEKLFKRYFKNEYLRIAVGGILIVLLTLIVGTTDYNGGGIPVITRIFESGEVRYEAFLLKIIFTAITVAAGFKGGEIIPTLFIGATLGGALGIILGIGAPFGAAVGMAALFCGVTNCPLATVFLCTEMFGEKGIIFYAISVMISFLLSGKCSLYSSQKFETEKIA